MPRPLPYASLPTITQLYASSTLVPTTTAPRPLRTIPHLPRTSRFNDTISLYRGDITALPVTAIVNAANSSLLGGGGVDGAIHRAAGRGLLRECRDLDGCETGDAKLTGGHELPAKHVVHAVGPIYSMERDREGTEEKLLSGCYKKTLELVSELPKEDEQDDQDLPKLSIAFSGLSTGVYGYPKREAARVAIATVLGWLLEHEGGGFDKVCFCCFEEADYDAYIELLPQFCPLEEGVDQADSEETHDDTEEELPELPSVPNGQLKSEGEPDSKKVKTAHEE